MRPRSNALTIRKATVDDTAQIIAIAQQAYAKYVARIGRRPAPMLADFGILIATDRCVVIEDGERIAAGYLVSWPEADAYFIEDIAVNPAQQGRGLGRRLMEHAASEARRLGLPTLRLYTNAAMTENLSLYAHMGFVETHHALEDGYDRVYMRLAL